MTSVQARQMTRILVAAVAALGAGWLLLMAGLGRGVPGPGLVEPEPVPELQLSEAQVELPPSGRFVEVASRPLFAEDRRPEPKILEEPGVEPEAPPSVPLNVALTGIIHTPTMRVALLRDNATGQSLNLRERMVLPGDQGGWQVKSIKPREVVFEDAGSESETTLELGIGTGAAQPALPPPPMAPSAMAQPAQSGQQAADGVSQADTAEDEVAQRAAEIRRRIEERRAQLRREAEQTEKQ
jgi:general secretion pathway protein N